MVKIAVVGCGGVMEEHYHHLIAMDEVRLVGHCDIDEKRARSAADRFGGEAFANSCLMYDKTKPDAVYVCVPPHAHGDIEVGAAERGIHLFVEKPVALDAATANRVDAAIRRNKVTASVGYCFRYCDTVNRARQLLKGKAISLVSGWYACSMPRTWWWRRRQMSGGQMVEQSTHIFDLLRYLCGDVAEVYAMASRGCMNKVEDFDVDDSSVATLRLKCGATASVVSSCVAFNGGRTGLEIYTPEATFTLDGTTLRVKQDCTVTEYSCTVSMYAEEDQSFVDAVANGRKNRIRSTYADGKRTLLTTLAANESIASGLPVKP